MEEKKQRCDQVVVVVVDVGVVVVMEGIKLGPVRAAVLNCE